MGSQKKEALEKYRQLISDYEMDYPFNTMNMISIDLIPEGEKVSAKIIKDTKLRITADENSNIATFISNHLPVFIRACPLVPRPGVLESTPAYSSNEAWKIIERISNKMLSKDKSPKPMYDNGYIDPYGSIIIMPYINADASAVASLGHYIYMGEGKDGITAGGDGFKMAVPLKPMSECSVANDLRKHGFDPAKLELEFVSVNNTTARDSYIGTSNYIVQLRGCEGPRAIAPAPKGVTISGTFHGEGRIIVEHVFLCADDSEEELAKLEDALREGMPSGTVVIHPTGCHLTHHAGQCMKYNVPYIASANVKVGEQWTQAAAGWVVLDPNGTYEPQPYDMTDYIDEFIQGLNSQIGGYARQHGWLSNMFHQFMGGPINDPHHTAILAGAFVGWLAKATLSVGMGETRHIVSNTEGNLPLVQMSLATIYRNNSYIVNSSEIGESYLSSKRRHYYADIEATPMSWKSVESMYQIVGDAYGTKIDWSTSYGGAKYRKSMKMGLNTTRAIIKLLRHPSASNLKDLCDKANANEHATHNTNFFFSKFLSKSALDWGTKPQHIHTLSPFNMFYAGLDVMNNLNTSYNTKSFDKRVANVHKEYKSETIESLRKSPIGLRSEGLLREGMKTLNENQRHPRGQHSNPGNLSTYIPCGINNCKRCAEYLDQMKYTLVQNIQSNIPVQESFVLSFPVQLIGKAVHEESMEDLSNKLTVWKNLHTQLNTFEKRQAIDSIKKITKSIPHNIMAKNNILITKIAYFFSTLDAELLIYFNTNGDE